MVNWLKSMKKTGVIMDKPETTICMATYNGREFLKEQIDSFFSQTCKNWQLLIRDDGSSDGTLDVIGEYTDKYHEKIKLVSDSITHLGASLNFGKLLEHVDSKYIMFSDQDDIWLPEKIEITLNAMKAAEEQYPDIPVLVHTDLKVVDSNLGVISDSMWRYQRLFPDVCDNINKLQAHNVVTGCTVTINRKARDVCLPIPQEAVMYDWWLALCVAKYGEIVSLSDQTILYRQHASNEIGAKKFRRINILNFFRKLFSIKSLIFTQYRMVRKFDPNVGFCMFIYNKICVKISQKFRRPYFYND